MSSEDLFADSLPSNLSPGSLGSTPIDASGVVGTAAPADTADTSAAAGQGGQTCPECRKFLKTRSGFTRHMFLHKINDYNSRKPLEEDIESFLFDFFKEILTEISKEPAVGIMGAQKRECVAALSQASSTDVSLLLEAVSKPLMECVLLRTKIMPSAQYEEALKNVNKLLANPVFCEDVKSKLILCAPEVLSGKSDNVLQRLVWRITTKLMNAIQERVFRYMRAKHLAAYESYTMKEDEMETFKNHIGNILRAVYKFGLKTQNSIWALRVKCLQERFIESSKAMNSDLFLNSNLWEENIISVSSAAFSFFLGVERIIQSQLDSESACTAKFVFDSLTNVENLILLDHVRELTRGILSEDLAMDFTHDLLKSVTELSGKLDAKRKLDKVKQKQKASQVSLRTNLKRNPVAGIGQLKATEDDPDDPSAASPSSRPVAHHPKDSASTSRRKVAQPKKTAASTSNPAASQPEDGASASKRKGAQSKRTAAPTQSETVALEGSKVTPRQQTTAAAKNAPPKRNPTRTSSRKRSSK